MDNKVIELKNFKIKLNSKKEEIIYEDMTICKGDFIIIEGGNGMGKTTLLNALYKYSPNDYYSVSGDLLINNKSIRNISDADLRRNQVVYISQKDLFLKGESTYNALLRQSKDAITKSCNYKEKINEIKTKINEYYYKYLKDFFKDNDERSVLNNLFFTAKSRFKYQNVSSLSGGQQKLVHILKGLIKASVFKVPILLIDEPLNNLDKERKIILLELIENLRRENPDIVILLITHCRVFKGISKSIRIESVDGGYRARLLNENINPFNCLFTEDK